MIRPALLLGALLGMVACADGAPKAGDAEPGIRSAPGQAPPAAQPQSAAAAATSHAAIAPVPVEARALPAKAAHEGTVVAARRWTDGLGENLLILTEAAATESAECCGWDGNLYAYHYVQRDSGLALLWRTTDFIHTCDVDMTVQMGEHTLAITDLDADGVAETTFLYILACRGDVSPATMKLIMHEGAEKYAIRGTTDEDPRLPDPRRGEMNVDPSFDRAPPAFRSFAVAHWKKFTSEEGWRAAEER
jgi:hypothetical protein